MSSENPGEVIDLSKSVEQAEDVVAAVGHQEWETAYPESEPVESIDDTGVDIEAELVECTIEDPPTPATSEVSDISKSATNSGRVTPASQSDVASVSSSEKSTPSRKRRSADLAGRQIEFDNVSTSSGSVKVTKFPVRIGIQWKKGERLEAMDFMQKWFPAKIREINEEELEILIHFDGWNQRYDEWISMNSERIRPMTRHSARKDANRKPRTEFKVGERVLAKWTDCKMYEAKVTAVFPNGSVEVIFYDGFKKLVQPINLRPIPAELKARTFEVRSPAEEVLKKSKLKLDSTESQEKASPPFTTSKLIVTSPNDGDTFQSELKKEGPSKADVKKSGEPKKTFTSKEKPKSRSKDQKHRKKMLVSGSIFARPRVTEADKALLGPALTPMVKLEPVSTQTDYTSKQVETVESEISAGTQSTEDPSLDTSDSFLSAAYAMPIPRKAFVIESDHNQYKCPFQDCGKGFRKENLLDYHIKYYHVDGGKPPDPAPSKKRRKTIGPCSTDPQQSTPHVKKSSTRKQRHTSESGVRRAKKHRHVSESGITAVKKSEVISECEVALTNVDKETDMKAEADIKMEVDTTEAVDTNVKQEVEEITSQTSLKLTTEELVEALPENIKADPDSEAVKSELRSECKHRRSESQDTTMTEESTDAEDYLKPDELVNCICGYYEENGLMIQCEVCMCWQHASCFGITDRTLPKVYVCYVCENPPGVRESYRYIHEQDWFKTGEIASFGYLNTQPPTEERCNSIKSTHSLIADINQLNAVLHTLKRQLKILRTKDEKQLKQWHLDWDMVESLDESLETNQSTDTADGNVNEYKEGDSSGPSKGDDSQYVGDSRQPETGSDEANAEESAALSSETDIAAKNVTEEGSADKECNLDNQSNEQDDVNKTNGEQEQEAKDGTSQSNGETGVNHSPGGETTAMNGTAGPSSVNGSVGEISVDQSEPRIASGAHDTAVESKVESSIQIPAITSLLTDEDPNHSDSTESALADEDPIETCERNLVQHILRIQAEISRRMDLIEEQINVLEALEPSYTGQLDQGHQPDITHLKKNIKTMDYDLGKVKRMAVFH